MEKGNSDKKKEEKEEEKEVVKKVKEEEVCFTLSFYCVYSCFHLSIIRLGVLHSPISSFSSSSSFSFLIFYSTSSFLHFSFFLSFFPPPPLEAYSSLPIFFMISLLFSDPTSPAIEERSRKRGRLANPTVNLSR